MYLNSKRWVNCAGEVSLIPLLYLCLGILLLAWSAYSAVQLFDVLNASKTSVVDKTAINQTSSTSELTRELVDIKALKAIPLFGEADAVPVVVVPVEKPEEKLEETKLNLVLKGLFTSDSNELGQAIIANGRNDQLYQVGDELEGLSNVSLLEVFSDGVKLSNRGNAEVLYLYPEGERLSSRSTDQDGQNSEFIDSSENNSIEGMDGGVGSPEVNEDQKDDNLGLINKSVQVKKLNEIIRVVRERDKATGDMLGFRVLPGRDRESFDASGLQVNDVITSIDGENLTDLRSAMTIYRNKRDASKVSLMVNRAGSELSVDLDLNALK